jgi:hypothetical protein
MPRNADSSWLSAAVASFFYYRYQALRPRGSSAKSNFPLMHVENLFQSIVRHRSVSTQPASSVMPLSALSRRDTSETGQACPAGPPPLVRNESATTFPDRAEIAASYVLDALDGRYEGYDFLSITAQIGSPNLMPGRPRDYLPARSIDLRLEATLTCWSTLGRSRIYHAVLFLSILTQVSLLFWEAPATTNVVLMSASPRRLLLTIESVIVGVYVFDVFVNLNWLGIFVFLLPFLFYCV